LAQEDLDTIKGWLESHGFKVGYVYPTRMVMDISGTAGQIREAFHTEIHHYEVNGTTQFANASDPSIPAALAPAVTGVVSMHDFKPHTNIMKHAPQETVICGAASCSGDTFYLVVPGDVQTIYNLNPVYRQGIYGQNQTIVVLEDAMPYMSDPTTPTMPATAPLPPALMPTKVKRTSMSKSP
jgi:subtilase family serine protease